MYKVRFHFKSGELLTTVCENLKIKDPENELTAYSITGMTGEKILYLRMDDISAITAEEISETGGRSDGQTDAEPVPVALG